MPRDVATVPAVVIFARYAPAKMPGQTRYPNTRNAARAIPVGGHTAVALACTKRSEEHTSELQSRLHLVCRLLLEKKKKKKSTREEQAIPQQSIVAVHHL